MSPLLKSVSVDSRIKKIDKKRKEKKKCVYQTLGFVYVNVIRPLCMWMYAVYTY